MRRVKAQVDRLLGWFLTMTMGVAVLVVLWQIASRFVLTEPSFFTDELVRYLLIWIGFLGASYAAGQRLHLGVDLLSSRLEGRARHVLGLMIQAVILSFALAVMVYGGVSLVHLTLLLGQRSAALGIPLGWVYLVLPLSGLVLSFYAGVFAHEHLLALGRLKRPAEDRD